MRIFSGWLKVEGKFQQIFSGPECVIALAGNRDIYYRANLFEREGKVCNIYKILTYPYNTDNGI